MKQEPDLTATTDDHGDVVRPGAKGRPTPKRKAAQAQRRNPIVPADPREAKRRGREHARIEREQRRLDLARGEGKYLPERDRGPIAKFVRDLVDTRYNVAEYMLVLAILILFLGYIPNLAVQRAVFGLMWALLIAVALDLIILSRIIRRRVGEEFGEDALAKRPVSYGILRAMQFRRFRLPRPTVECRSLLSR